MASWSGKFRRLTSTPLAVVLLALVLRLIAVGIWSDDLNTDTDAYLSLANGLAHGDGYVDAATGQPTAFRPPLYPIFVAILVLTNIPHWGLGILQAVIGALTVKLTWHLGRQLQLNATRATIAAALVAIDPILIRYTSHAMTETLFTFLVLALLQIWTKADQAPKSHARNSWLGGLMLGLCALCRPTVWGLAILAAIDCLRRQIQSGRFSVNWRFVAGAAIVISPWVIRNWVQFERPIATTTHGGYTLLLGNNPVFQKEVVEASFGKTWSRESLTVWQSSLDVQMASEGVTGEVARNAWMSNRAQQNIKSSPLDFMKSCVFKLLRFWGVAPLQASLPERIITGAFYSAILIAFAIQFIPGMVRFIDQPHAARLIILSIAATTMIHTLYWSNMRMRAPLIPLIAVIAVGALSTKQLGNHLDSSLND